MSAMMIRKGVPIACVILAGCAPPLPPIVKPSLKCDINPALVEHCSQPVRIQEGVTYEQLIGIAMQDRESLRICAQRQEDLADAAGICKAAIDEYNKSVADSNPKGGQPK